MALKDLIPQPKTLTFAGGDLTLYPLTVKDVILLLQSYTPEMNSMMEGKVDIPKLIAEAPSFVASLIIASARDEESSIEDVAKLPFAVQLLALQVIWDISAVDGDMLGKFVLRLAEGMQKLNLQLREQSVKQMLQSGESVGT